MVSKNAGFEAGFEIIEKPHGKKLGGKHFLPPVIKLERHISSLFSDNTFLDKELGNKEACRKYNVGEEACQNSENLNELASSLVGAPNS
jgi:hypothetical protein